MAYTKYVIGLYKYLDKNGNHLKSFELPEEFITNPLSKEDLEKVFGDKNDGYNYHCDANNSKSYSAFYAKKDEVRRHYEANSFTYYNASRFLFSNVDFNNKMIDVREISREIYSQFSPGLYKRDAYNYNWMIKDVKEIEPSNQLEISIGLPVCRITDVHRMPLKESIIPSKREIFDFGYGPEACNFILNDKGEPIKSDKPFPIIHSLRSRQARIILEKDTDICKAIVIPHENYFASNRYAKYNGYKGSLLFVNNKLV